MPDAGPAYLTSRERHLSIHSRRAVARRPNSQDALLGRHDIAGRHGRFGTATKPYRKIPDYRSVKRDQCVIYLTHTVGGLVNPASKNLVRALRVHGANRRPVRCLGERNMAKLVSQFEDDECGLPHVRQIERVAPRVYLVSDVRLYREGLSAGLAQNRQLDLVGAGGSGDFLDRIVGLQTEVLLLDLGAAESLSIPRRARRVLPAIRVVAFAVAEIGENVLACAEAGISGYVTTDGSIEDLVSAVLNALRGELMCSPRIAALLFSRMATLSDGRIPGSADSSSLTPREREIAALIACNLRNKEIARRLRLGPTTVKNHVHNILQKLNVRRRADIPPLHLDGTAGRPDQANQAPNTSGTRPDPSPLEIASI